MLKKSRLPLLIVFLVVCAFQITGCAGKPFVAENIAGISAIPEPPLKISWVHKMGPQKDINYEPIESAGVACDGERVYVGSQHGVFYALDMDTGNEVWSYKTYGPIHSTPTIMGDRVIFGDSDGVVYALRISDGALIWQYETRGEILSEPLVEGERVFFTSSANNLIALNAITGEWIWLFERPIAKDLSMRGTASPVISNGVIYVGFSDGFIVAVSATDGRELWKNSLQDEGRFRDVDATVLLHDDLLYVSSYQGGFYALKPINGAIQWRQEGGGVSRPAAAGGYVFFMGTDSVIFALDQKNGKIVWEIDLTELEYKSQAVDSLKRPRIGVAPVIVGDMLVAGSNRGELYYLKQSDGSVVWSFIPGTGVGSRPLVVGDKLYFLSNEGHLYCMVPQTFED